MSDARLSLPFLRVLSLVLMLCSLTFGQDQRRNAKSELEPVVNGLISPDPIKIRDSAYGLSQLTPAGRVLLAAEASTVLARLMPVLDSRYPPEVRQAAAYGIGCITASLRGRMTLEERRTALEALSRALDPSNPDPLRGASAWATSNLLKITGTKMAEELRMRLLDELTNLVESSTPGIAAAGAEALGAVFRNADEAPSGYHEQPQPAVTTLLNLLANTADAGAQTAAINALGSIHRQSEQVISALTHILSTSQNADVRIVAATVLGEIGSGAEVSGQALASALLDSNETLQVSAASSLASIGPKAAGLPHVVEYLGIALQQDNSPQLQETAAWALGKMGTRARSEADDLMKALENDSPGIRRNAAWALGEIISPYKTGPGSNVKSNVSEAEKVCRRLTTLLNDSDANVRSAAASALAVSAGKAERGNTYELIPCLEQAQEAVMSAASERGALYGDPSAEQALRAIRDSIADLKGRSFRQHFLFWANNKWVIGGAILVALYVCWFLVLRFAVLLRRPLLILGWNDALESQALKLPGVLTNINVPLRHLLLVGLYRFDDRVLDAWVQTHSSAARESFTTRPLCKERSVWVPLPVVLQDDVLPELRACDLLPLLNRKRWRIRILGEGGSGKTSLACQLALWGMHEQSHARLSPDIMLPVVLGPNSSANIQKDLTAFTDAIRRELQVMIGSTEPVSKELMDRLLRKKRIVVFLDGVSEMPHERGAWTEEWESVKHPDFPVNALVLTSRVEDTFADGINFDIAPLRIDTNHLLPFMNAYLGKAGRRLDDVTLYESCRRLAAMVGIDRGITPLMARLYAQHLITATPFANQAVRQFPRNLPELVLAYLNVLNQKRQPEEPDNPTLHLLAKIAAWECLRKDFRPIPTLIADVLAAMEKEGFGRREIELLEKSTGLIKVIAPEEKEIYFALDSIADYLGAMRAAELCQSDEDWRDLLARCRTASGFPETAKGFVVALDDYCAAKQSALRIPQFAMNEITTIRLMCEGISEISDRTKGAVASNV
jgi:HEAT repeat protein